MAGGGEVIDRPSPNHGDRRGGLRPELVVLHYTAMATAEAALDRLCATEFEVSAHYLVAEDGRVFRLVDEGRRAWHAGASAWGPVRDVNSASIGIELANTGNAPFAAAQMTALEGLLAGILSRHGIKPERVIAHSDCAPGRKIDPGPRFDWRRLALGGLSVWPEAPEPVTPEPEGFVALLRCHGYTADVGAEDLLRAFRLRFRPGATGPLSPLDMGIAAWLARRYPVDRGAATS